jgi:tetratricopeptide (TPR) repeat protein
MNQERWQRVRAVFEQAVELGPEARRELLQTALGDDDVARAEVERLLAAAAATGNYLAPPSAQTLAGLLADGAGGQPGLRIGAFELRAEIGRGGQGSVWSAVDTRIGRLVALKLLPAGLPAPARARFRREAEITSRLQHPGICTVYDVELDADRPFVAMRLVPGESLQQRLTRARDGAQPLDVDTALGLVEQAARALHAAHAAGVVHRDVKPGNLMLTPDGQIVVLDFGIARELDGDSPGLTRTGEVFGTPAYMAPEQIEGAPADARSDVWSLGVVMFEALLLRPPFHEATREALYRAILSQPLDRAMRRLPADLRVMLATALAKEPDRRYATALDFALDIAACRAGKPIAARPVGLAGRWWRWAKREPRAAALAASLLLALLGTAGLAGYLLAQQGRLEAGAMALARRRHAELMRDVSSGLIRLGTIEPEVRAALANGPRMTGPRATLAIGLAVNNRIDDALALLDAAPVDQEQPRALARARAIVLRAGKRNAEADAIEADLGAPRSALEAYFASVAAESDGKPDGEARARAAIRLSVLLLPDDSETYLHRLILCTTGDPGARDECLRAAAALEAKYPESALAWFYIGLAHAATDPARSRAASRRAIELDASFPQPYVTEHLFLMQDGEFDAASATFERGLAGTAAGSAERQQLLVVRAQACLAHGRFAEALDAAERALEIFDRSITVLMLKAKAQRGLALPAAETTLQRVLELAPTHAEALQLLGG